jgi:protein O-mannosyl-transferase
MQKLLEFKHWLIPLLIAVVTLICFRNAANNQFSCWDDDYYVTNDPYIRSFSAENLKTIFTQDITKNNYHPLCMLSLAVNYHFAQLSPSSYYLTNVAIHVFNSLLIFLLFLQLCALLKVSENGKYFVASFGSLWFAVHPMHVESVGWIAERKDVLYGFFYFLGLITYLRYINTQKIKWYWLTLFVFILSCLSKPMAVVFPVSLLCLDLLAKRNWSNRLVTEKLVFFLLSAVCGGFAVYTQHKAGAIADFGKLTLPERIMYACYGFDMYIYKLFDPTYLSTFYPYPYRYITGYLPAIYYAAPFIAVFLPIIALIVAYYFGTERTAPIASATSEAAHSKKSKGAKTRIKGATSVPPVAGQTNIRRMITSAMNNEAFRVTAFGFGYFLTNVIFVLQFISVGAAIMADRYSYVSYVGLLFMLFYFLNRIMAKFNASKIALICAVCIYSGGLALLCYERNFVWHDSETLLSDAIEKFPMRALLSYKWLGNYYLDKGEVDKALDNYNVLAYLRAADAKVYDNIGVIYNKKNMPDSAIEAFDKSVAVQNNVPKTYLDRSVSYFMKHDTTNALRDLAVAYRLDPRAVGGSSPAASGTSAVHTNKAEEAQAFNFVQVGQYEKAIAIYNKLLETNKSNPYYYFYRGVAEYGLDKADPAIADWEIAVKMNSTEVRQSASNNLSVAYDKLDMDDKALYYAEMSMALGYKIAPDFIAKLKDKKKAQEALKK